MRLNEIKPATDSVYDLTEGVIPPHISLTLGQVVRDGKVTNNVQHFILAGLIEMFKSGGPYRWPRDINPYDMSANANLIDSVKTLSDEEATSIAAWLLDSLQRPANFEKSPYCSHSHHDPVEWARWVLSKQD